LLFAHLHDIFPYFVILKDRPIAVFSRIWYYIHMKALFFLFSAKASFFPLFSAKNGGFLADCMKNRNRSRFSAGNYNTVT
jgi:hypothetical protein